MNRNGNTQSKSWRTSCFAPIAMMCALALVSSGSLSAQSSPGSVTPTVALRPVAATEDRSPSCELHIFPATEITDASESFYNSAGAYGIIGVLVAGALTAAQSSGSGKLRVKAVEQMRAMLKPEVQVEEIKKAGVLAILKLPADTKIVAEDALPPPYVTPKDSNLMQAYAEYMAALKKNRAIKRSESPCYRELIIRSISVSKGLGGFKFTSEFIYRTFGSDFVETHLFDGDHSVVRPDQFPAQTSDTEPAANAALRAAFATNFTQWVAHRVKV